MFIVSVSSVQKYMIESTTSCHCIHETEADNTSGKTNIWKDFIINKLRLQICILICVKKWKV